MSPHHKDSALLLTIFGRLLSLRDVLDEGIAQSLLLTLKTAALLLFKASFKTIFFLKNKNFIVWQVVVELSCQD